MSEPKTEPMIRAARKAYRESELAKVDALLEEQSRWLRKRTIAANKLADVRRRIDALLTELATPQPEKGQTDAIPCDNS